MGLLLGNGGNSRDCHDCCSDYRCIRFGKVNVMRENSFMYHDYRLPGRVWEFPIGPVDPWDEAIADDRELFPRVHIHVSGYGTDCDGAHGNDYITWPDERDNLTADEVRHYVNPDEMVGTFDVNKMWRHAVRWIIDFTPEYGGTLSLEMGETTYDRSASWRQRTDEGGHSAELRMCIDDCDDRHTVYDQYAQEAGY